MADGLEIERKFLVARLPDLAGVRSETVRQGYVSAPADSVQVRVRQKGTRHFLTIKSGIGLARAEREIVLTRAQFDTLWPATEGRRVQKTRWTGRLADGVVFELDVFEGALAPLLLVEVEFTSIEAAQGFAPPDWFGRDVTEDRAYSNARLAADGAPPV